MISRRYFLASSISTLLAFSEIPYAEARKQLLRQKSSGIHILARDNWPPAIVPDHVAFIDRGLSCFSDQFGKIAIVEFRKNSNPITLGELTIVGKKVVDFTATKHRGYALVVVDSPKGDLNYVLTTISLAPASEPSILSSIEMNQFDEATNITATSDFICVGGESKTGGNQIIIFTTKGRSLKPEFVSYLPTELPVCKLDLQEKNLVVLQRQEQNSQIDYISLLSPQKPQIRKTIKLNGNFHTMARSRNVLLVAGLSSETSALEVKTISLEPSPQVIDSQALTQISTILDAAAYGDRFVILGEQGAERKVISFKINGFKLTPEQTVSLPGGKSSSEQIPSIALKDHTINVASGWLGVDILSMEKSTWQHSLTYNIPRFPASGIVLWDDQALLAGADLKLYDISKPERPILVANADSGSIIKSIAGSGSYIVLLEKNSLSLRKLDKLSEQIATMEIAGLDMSYDKQKHKAYVLSAQDKKTTITPISTYSNKLIADKPLDFQPGYRHLFVDGNLLALSALDHFSVYDISEEIKTIGKQKLENYAILDLVLVDEYIITTVIDKSSKGSLIIYTRDEKEVTQTATMPLPHDGTALAVMKNQVVITGKDKDGKDMVSIIDISNASAPKLIASLPSVEASSAVAIKNNLAFVAGRGLAVLSLS